MSIVEEHYNPKIFKVRQIHSHIINDFTTYVFIGGYYDNNINKILDKLEKNDYPSLTSDENKTLAITIPNFRAKIGKIVIGKTYFINDLIFDDDSINIIKMKISYHINKFNENKSNTKPDILGINQLHLWIETGNINFDDLIKFINYLLGKNSEITLDQLVEGLKILLDVSSQEEIEEIVKKKLFIEKYKNKADSQINLFNNETYSSDNLINNEEFIALMTHRFIILGRTYRKKIKITYNSYSELTQLVIANPFSEIVNLSDRIVMDQDSNQYSRILSSYGLIENNMIYIVSHSDFVNSYRGHNLAEIVSLYWDNQVSEYTTNKLENEKESIKSLIQNLETMNNNLLKLNLNKDGKAESSLINLSDDYKISNIVFGVNDINYQNNFDIEKIFNIFETSEEIPFIKYTVNDTTQSFRLYKPFLKKNIVKLKIIAGWRNTNIIQDVKYPSNKKSIVFKLLHNANTDKALENYITIHIYENSYIMIVFNIKDYITIREVKDNLEKVGDFLSKIKKLDNNNIIHLPESNLIFKSGYHSGLIRTQILNINLKTQVELLKEKKFSLTLEELNDRIGVMFPFFYSNYKNNVIKMIYKKVDSFDSEQSIQNFVFKLFEKTKKIADGNKIKYLELLESVFLIDRNQAKLMIDNFNPQNIPENVKSLFLYGIDITITKEKNNFIIIIENVHQINQVKNIHNIFNILFDPNLNIEEISTKLLNKSLNKALDIELDIQEKQIFETQQNELGEADIGFQFDELEFEDLDLGVYDNQDLEKEFNEKQKVEEEAKQKAKEAEKIVIDYDIKKKGADAHKVKFTNYMAQMREKADPGLYKVEEVGNIDKEQDGDSDKWKYSRTCDAAQMRQPVVIPKENLEKIKDKKSITGYIKYRDNYYICPRIWDYKAEMPISVDEFTKNGLKSPYTQGQALPYDKRNKEFLGDKYTVIIRRPTNEPYWAKEKAEKGWPDILKNTGSEAFPGFMKPKNHPKNLCVPCCFLKEPDDYDINAPEIQKFKKPVGHDVCDVQSESMVASQSGSTKEFNDALLCKNENYIKNDYAILDNCRYGNLPENLNTLLRNHQEIMISSANNSLHKYANCFLRRGVFSDKNSFLRSIASIKETISNTPITFKNLILLITDNLTPEIFITLNEGSLINIFKFQYNLPKNRLQMQIMLDFVKKYPDFVEWVGLKNLKIENLEDLFKIQYDKIQFRKFKKLFTVFGAFNNFIKYCEDDKIIKRHEFFLDLFSRPIEWLFPDGANILMFSKETNNIYCNPYINSMSKPLIMLLYDKNGKFEPIFHTQLKGNIIPRGLIPLNNEVNMSSNNLTFLKNNLKNQIININLLKNTQKRLPILKELVKIHLNNCNESPNTADYGKYKIMPTATVMYNELVDFSENIDSDFEPMCQITTPLHTTEFIITKNKMVFPVRPSGVIPELPIYDGLEYFDLIDTEKIEKNIRALYLVNAKSHNKYHYKPVELIVTDENPDIVIAILLENEGMIPIYPTELSKINAECEKLKLKITVVVKNIYYETDFKIFDNNQIEDDRIGYLMEYQKFEYLFQHFKYEISSFFGENKKSTYLNEIYNILNENQLTKDYNLMVVKIINILEKISNKILKISTTNDFTNQENENKYKSKLEKQTSKKKSISLFGKDSKDSKGKDSNKNTQKNKYSLITCNKLSQKKCNQHPYCHFSNKNGCSINVETRFWLSLFIHRLVESLVRNPLERKIILEGKYSPSFLINQGIQLNKNEILLTNENFYLIKQIYRSSKYHQEIGMFETIESESVHDRVVKPSFTDIDEESKDLGASSISSSDSSSEGLELSDLSGVKKKLKNVYATVFDKDGKYRSQYQAGPCIFPYVYGNTKQLYFDCNKDKDEGQRCPVEVDKGRRALKWGFCPADPRETRRKNNVEEINAKATNMKGKIDKGFKSGKCIFPFRYHPSYDLSWECVSTKHGQGQKWCATGIKTGKNVASELPVAADKNEKVYQKRWDYSSMYDSKGNFNDEFLRYNTRGYCPVIKNEDKTNVEQDEEVLTIDNFIMNKCAQTDSKGGYSKKILKKFMIEQLGYKESTIDGKKKEDLCAIIGETLSGMKSRSDYQGRTLLDIYKKDPKMCDKGESGGGWYLGTLRKMASRYFGMDPTIAKEASKSQLCDFITPILDEEAIRIEKNKPVEKIVLSSIYKKNPAYCEEGQSKGGYNLKELKEMGVKYFGIPPEMNNKSDICKIIIEKLDDEKAMVINYNKYIASDMSDIEDENSYSFFDELSSLKNFKNKNFIYSDADGLPSDMSKSYQYSYDDSSMSNSEQSQIKYLNLNSNPKKSHKKIIRKEFHFAINPQNSKKNKSKK